MKKKYEKPLIAVENYVLTQTIADCGVKIGFADRYCVIDDNDAPRGFRDLASIGYFTASGSGCFFEPSSNQDGYDKICYHTQAAMLFTS